jgi:hypothetical protein
MLMRDLAVKGVPLSQLFADGSVLKLAVNAAVFLILGLLAFAWAERTARDWGTLNQY